MVLVRIMQFVFFLNILLTLTISRVDSIGSFGRAKSPILLRASTLRRSQSNLSLQTTSSTSSIVSSRQQQIEMKSIPVASTSSVAAEVLPIEQGSLKVCEGDCFKKVNLQPESVPLIEARPMASVFGINVREASEATNRNAPLDPNRDGVYMRIRQILRQYVAPAAVGSAIGAGGFYVGKNSKTLSNITDYSFSTSTISYTTTIQYASDVKDDDEITNNLK